jgi:hypothetical protein
MRNHRTHHSEKKGEASGFPLFVSGAGEESRTLDLNLGKVALYQLSYSRIASHSLFSQFGEPAL